jgi:CheY-like chemotaxis protein
MNVLIVDDNAINRKLLRAVLEGEGLTVLEAVDGVEALAVLEREKVDAVMSDILMPRLDGYRLCYEVRSNPLYHHLPFIIYTATYTSPGDEKLSLDLGADRFIRKPAPAKVIAAALHATKRTR